jgi:26S proteasome regulatory subunit N2
MVPTQSSAAGVLALLSEPEPIIKQHALKSLVALVPQFWAEISEHIALMYAREFHFSEPSYSFSSGQ